MVNAYDAQLNQMYAQYPRSTASRVRKAVGTTMITGMIGMTAYYLPVSKDSFVQTAFDIKKAEAVEQINALKNIADEVAKNNVSTQSKMILTDMSLAEDVTEITNKCTQLEKNVTDADIVKSFKENLSNNFESYKKNKSLMDNTCTEAFKSIKWGKFRWGMGIGAAIGLALSLVSGE